MCCKQVGSLHTERKKTMLLRNGYNMITIEHLTKRYGDKVAVDDISLHIRSGEIVGFLGPNGAGKTTTMNILTGYLSSTAGTILIDEIDMQDHPLEAKQQIGFLPEQPPLYVDMTVEEYLNFNYDLKGCKLDRAEHLLGICETVKIKDVMRKQIRSLSKGYRQRVGIAQALVGNPKVIIFDEPTIGLDPKQIIEIRNLIRGLGKSHTVILSTHILQEVQAVCDRIVIINKGRIVANEKTENISSAVAKARRFHAKICGPQKEILSFLRSVQGISYAESLAEREGDAYTYLIESEYGVDIRKKLFFDLAARNWAMIGLEALGMSLEDIFISVVEQAEARPLKTNARAPRRQRGKDRTQVENDIGAELLKNAKEQRAEAALHEVEDED